MPNRKPRQIAVTKADKYFSLYIRQREADARGYTICHSCGSTKHWKELDCGHFKSRTYYATRWDERNAASQCKRCNKLGEQYELGKFLNQTFGEGTAEEMDRLCRQVTKLTTKEIEQIAEHFKSKL